MKSFLKILCIAFCIIFTVSSCQKKVPPIVKHIPKDASFVGGLNLALLNKKVSSGNLNIDSIILSKIEEDTTDTDAKEFYNFIKNCGIDLNSQLYFFVNNTGSLASGQVTSVNFMATIKDVKQLDSALQSKMPNQKVQSKDGIKYMLMHKDGVVAWKDDVFIASWASKIPKINFNQFPKDSTSATIKPVKDSADIDVLSIVQTYLNQKESESVSDIKHFRTLMQEKVDAWVWSNSNGAADMFGALSLTMPKVVELIKDNYTASTFSFENGKMIGKSITYTNDLLSKILKKHAGPTVNFDLMKGFDAKTVNGLMAFSFDPKLFQTLAQELELSDFINIGLAKAGFTQDDLFNALKGDINVLFGDLSNEKNSDTKPRKFTSTAKFIFQATIADKKSLDKILAKVVETGMLQKSGNQYLLPSGLNNFGALSIDDKHILFSADSATLAAYKSNQNKLALNQEIRTAIENKSIAIYFDFQSVFKQFPIVNPEDEAIAVGFRENLKDLIITSDNFKSGKIESKAEIRMMNEKENSLSQLIKMSLGIYKGFKISRKQEEMFEPKIETLLFKP